MCFTTKFVASRAISAFAVTFKLAGSFHSPFHPAPTGAMPERRQHTVWCYVMHCYAHLFRGPSEIVFCAHPGLSWPFWKYRPAQNHGKNGLLTYAVSPPGVFGAPVRCLVPPLFLVRRSLGPMPPTHTCPSLVRPVRRSHCPNYTRNCTEIMLPPQICAAIRCSRPFRYCFVVPK